MTMGSRLVDKMKRGGWTEQERAGLHLLIAVAVLCAIVILLLSGCGAAMWKPLVDQRGRDMNRYAQDEQECRLYAQQVAGPGTQAAAGAVAGALIGALAARVVSRDLDRGQHARAGALLGAGGGAARGHEAEIHAVRECLRGRGYVVLN